MFAKAVQQLAERSSSTGVPGLAAESGEQVESEDKKTRQGENTREHEKNEAALPWKMPKEKVPEDLALVLARMRLGRCRWTPGA